MGSYCCKMLFCLAVSLSLLLTACSDSDEEEATYPMVGSDGSPITTVEEWESRREELKADLQTYLYGRFPEEEPEPEVLLPITTDLPECNAVMEEFILNFGNGLSEDVRITYPQGGGRYPVIVRLDYLCDWEYRSPLEEQMLQEGRYAFVTVGRKNVAPDEAGNRQVYGLNQYEANDLGALALWAYGAVAALDAIEAMDFADMDKVCITGHSRDGKAAICAAVMDERFSVVVPNGSGVGGASSFQIRGEGSESLTDLANNFPHWFCSRFNEYADCPEAFPVDMTDALAYIAPRPVLRTEAENDAWANPLGREDVRSAVDQVYTLYGVDTQYNAVSVRAGDHGQTQEDWQALIDFCDAVFYGDPFPSF